MCDRAIHIKQLAIIFLITRIMNNGILYPILNLIINKTKYLNLVEIYKWILTKIFRSSNKLTVNRVAIDSFIIIKGTYPFNGIRIDNKYNK